MADPEVILDRLKQETGITDTQLNSKVEEIVLQKIAKHFTDWEKFTGALGLNLYEADKLDVKVCVHSKGHEMGMVKALTIWLKRDPYVTYLTLLKIILEAGDGVLADKVCRTVSQRELSPNLVNVPSMNIGSSVSELTDSQNTADTSESMCLRPFQDTVITDPNMLQLPPSDPATAHCNIRALIQQPSASDLSDESHSSLPLAIASSQSDTNSSTTSSKQQFSYLLFECGCGKCSIYSYISGQECPNPKELPFPKLEVSKIPPEEIEYIEEDFCHMSVLICRKFYGLVCDTFKNLRERIDESELRSYLKLALKPKWYLQNAVYASGSLSKFENIAPDDLPEYLIDRNCCSWFDYDLIEDLRRRYLFPNVTEEDEPLEDYKKNFKCYVSQRCFIYLHDTGPWPKNQVHVKCKVDLEYSNLSQKLIKHLKYVFTKAIGAPAYHLAFKTAREGCTELTFGAPPYFSELTKLSKYQVTQLEVHGFIKVTICGQVLFQSRTYESSEHGVVSEISDDETNVINGGYLNDSLASIKLSEETDSKEVPKVDIDPADIELICTETKQKVSHYDSEIVSKKKPEVEEDMQLLRFGHAEVDQFSGPKKTKPKPPKRARKLFKSAIGSPTNFPTNFPKKTKPKPPKRARKLLKSAIGSPTNFRHLTHLGFDASTGKFNSDNIDPYCKKLLDRAKVTNKQLQDKKTAIFISKFIEQLGGIQAIRSCCDKIQDMIGSPPAVQPDLSVEALKKKTGVSDDQLETRIIECDLHILAGYFDNVETYLYKLRLSEGQRTDIKDLAYRRDTKTAMTEALKFWSRQPDPFAATYKALLQILVDLKRGDVAIGVCQYITDNVPNQK